jgi:undecaprenyl-diphosphatase
MAYAFNITNSLTLISISFSIFAWLLFQKTWRASVFWLANILFTLALAVTLQYMMKISPPDAHTLFYSTYAYPNICLAVFMTLVGSFVMFTYYDLIWLRHKKYIVAIMAFIIAIAAVPLLYLGFNWLSDCIASFCCGAISTWTCILFFHRKIQRLNIRPMLFIATIALIISTFISGIEETPALLEKLSQPDFRLSYPLTQWGGHNEPLASITRTNFLGNESELLAIQYAGNINALVQALQKTGWGNAPKASLTVILNRIGAKDRSQELPLFPDLYQAEKPLLVMTKKIDNTNEFLILRIWPSQVLLQPNNLPLWFGTIKFHRTWHWKTLPNTAEENELSPLLILQQDLSSFSRILTETDKPLCKALVCQKFILKIINNKTRPPDDDYY